MKQVDLLRVIEECGEVIQAATKMLRRVAPFELGFDCTLTREQREELHGKYTPPQKEKSDAK